MNKPKELNELSSKVLEDFFALEDFFRANTRVFDAEAFKDMLHSCVDKFVETSKQKRDNFRECLKKRNN